MRCMLHELLAAKILSPRYQIDAEMVWKAVQTELILGETHWSKCQRGQPGDSPPFTNRAYIRMSYLSSAEMAARRRRDLRGAY
jgi:hypothetical protein